MLISIVLNGVFIDNNNNYNYIPNTLYIIEDYENMEREIKEYYNKEYMKNTKLHALSIDIQNAYYGEICIDTIYINTLNDIMIKLPSFNFIIKKYLGIMDNEKENEVYIIMPNNMISYIENNE